MKRAQKNKTGSKSEKHITDLTSPHNKTGHTGGKNQFKSRVTRSVIQGTSDSTRRSSPDITKISDGSHGTEFPTFQTIPNLAQQFEEHENNPPLKSDLPKLRILPMEPQSFRTPGAEYTTEQITLADSENPPEENSQRKMFSNRFKDKNHLETDATVPFPNPIELTSITISPETLMSLEAEEDATLGLNPSHDGIKPDDEYSQKPVVHPSPRSYCVNIACLDHADFPEVRCLDLGWTNTVGNKFRPLKSKRSQLGVPITNNVFYTVKFVFYTVNNVYSFNFLN